MIYSKGASINYVDRKGGGSVSQMSTILHKLVNEGGEGVKKPQNPVNVVYGCP